MKELFIAIVKRTFGIRARNSLKVFIFKHPYLSRRESFFKKKKYKGELAKILREHKDIKGIIINPSISDWYMPLTQRFQHLAGTFADAGYLFFYGTHNLRYDKIEGFEKIKKNLYLTNQLEVLKDIDAPILYITWAANSFYTKRYKHKKLIYDYVDDLEMFPLLGDKIERCHEDLLDKADIVLVTANRLIEKIRDIRKDAILSHNAVNLSVFQVKNPKVPDVLKNIVAQKKPIIGYMGSLIASCFDYELLKYAAKERPDYNFVFIGPLDFDVSFKSHKWEDYPNIYFLGTLEKYEDLGAAISFYDVCTVPFILNKVTQSISPLKLFEYMAAGRPIVTTDMRECKKYKSVLASKNKEEYVANLDRGLKLKDDEEYKKVILKDATDNTWEARTKVVVDLLEKRDIGEKKEKVSILGVGIDSLSFEETIARAREAAVQRKPFFIVTANAEITYKGARNARVREIFEKADIVTPDGAGVLLAARLLGKKIPERVTGVDMSEKLFEIGEKEGLQFYFLGEESQEVLDKAVREIRKKHPKIKIVGWDCGGVCSEEGHFENDKKIVEEIKGLKPHIVLVGLGCPKQESWIVRHKDELRAVCIGVGGSFRFWSGEEKRASVFFQKAYLEGAYRLTRRPSRIWRFLVLPKFFFLVIKERLVK